MNPLTIRKFHRPNYKQGKIDKVLFFSNFILRLTCSPQRARAFSYDFSPASFKRFWKVEKRNNHQSSTRIEIVQCFFKTITINFCKQKLNMFNSESLLLMGYGNLLHQRAQLLSAMEGLERSPHLSSPLLTSNGFSIIEQRHLADLEMQRSLANLRKITTDKDKETFKDQTTDRNVSELPSQKKIERNLQSPPPLIPKHSKSPLQLADPVSIHSQQRNINLQPLTLQTRCAGKKQPK